MQSTCHNLLKCVDIISVALAVGLAMEDAPPRDAPHSNTEEDSSENGEEKITEEEEGGGGEEKNEEEKKEETGKTEGAVVEENMGGVSVTPEPSRNSPPTSGPIRSDHIQHALVVSPSVSKGEESSENPRKGKEIEININESEDIEIDINESEITQEIKRITEGGEEYECSFCSALDLLLMETGNNNLKRKRMKGKMRKNGEETKLESTDKSGDEYDPHLQSKTMGKRARDYASDPSGSLKNVKKEKRPRARALNYTSDSSNSSRHNVKKKGARARIPNYTSESSDSSRHNMTKKKKGAKFMNYASHPSDSSNYVRKKKLGSPKPRSPKLSGRNNNRAYLEGAWQQRSNRPVKTDRGIREIELVQTMQDSSKRVSEFTQYKKKTLHGNAERTLESAVATRDHGLRSKTGTGHVADQGITETEFVQHVRQLFEQAPAFTSYGKRELHSNSGRELDAAASVTHHGLKSKKKNRNVADQGVTEAEFVQHVQESLEQVPTSKGYEKKEMHSNSGRELESAASIRDFGLKSKTKKRNEADNGVTEAEFVQHVQESLEQAPAFVGYEKEGLHSNSGRELHSEGALKDAAISNANSAPAESLKFEKQGLVLHTRAIQSPSSAADIHTNFERELEAVRERDAEFHSRTELHPREEREHESRKADKKLVNSKRLSQRSLVGTGVAAALHMNPAHYMGTYSKSPEAEKPAQNRERKLSQRAFVGHGYAQAVKRYPGSSKNGEGLDKSQITRRMSQNDLLRRGYAATSHSRISDSAGPSTTPQASPFSQINEASTERPSSYASQGQRLPYSGETSVSAHPSQEDSATQMNIESSPHVQLSHSPETNEETNGDLVSEYTSSSSYSSNFVQQHPHVAQGDLNNSSHYHPHEQRQTTTHSISPEELGVSTTSSKPFSTSESSSDFFTRLHSHYPDPDPDGNRDGEGDSMSEDETDNYPLPPPPPNEDEVHSHQPILDHATDNNHRPPPPSQEYDVNNLHLISSDVVHHDENNFSFESQYISYPPPPLPSAHPWPWNPPNGDYLAPFHIDTSQVSSLQEATTTDAADSIQQVVDHSYLRVRYAGDRMLSRRPRCGLLIVTGMRSDQSVPPDRRKGNRIPRTPGRVDINFSPRVGDIILRHVRLPGQGAVEIWYPNLQTQDGDSLVRFKLDPFSYASGHRESSNLLIVKARGYINLQNMWVYMGRATHSVVKAEQRVLGIGAVNGRTLYAT